MLTTPGMLPETLRERVQASVVLVEAVDLGGRRTARVVVRKDLATGHLLSQAVLGPGVRSGDPGVSEQVRAGLARVREQVRSGLSPAGFRRRPVFAIVCERCCGDPVAAFPL